FYYHRWLKQGAVRSDLSDIQKAKQLLGEAIRVNPKAHFGREKYQVLAMDWLLSPKKQLETVEIDFEGDPEDPNSHQKMKVIPSFIKGLSGRDSVDEVRKKYPDAVRGLAGLIALGSSWENVDVFHNLALALRLLDSSTALSAVASLRAWELLAQGKQ